MELYNKKNQILMRFEMDNDFNAALNDFRCDFKCSSKYKEILYEILWHNFSEQSYPKHWLLSFYKELELEFEWSWFDELLYEFRSNGFFPDTWERCDIPKEGPVSLASKLSCLQRSITSISFSNVKLKNYLNILNDCAWEEPYIPTGPSCSTYNRWIAEKRNPTLKDDILEKGLAACPPYYPYDHSHIRFRNILKKTEFIS